MLRPPVFGDARELFPLLHGTSVIQHIGWDGPASLDEYEASWAAIVARAERGDSHFFTIVDPGSGAPAGSCDIRPDARRFRGTLGLWLGEPYQGRGLGTRVVAELVRYGFETLRLHRLDADVFVGNWPSRRALEKNGFELEATVRGASLKFGVPRDDWRFGLLNPSSPFV